MAANLALGTAQLGMAYGIANTLGKPKRQDAQHLLTFCANHGLTLWDTSPAYGDSERLIGEVISSLAIRPQIISKLPSIARNCREPTYESDLKQIVRRTIETSLSSLAIDRIDFYLIHDENDFTVYGADLLAVLDELRHEGMIGRLGISVYSPDTGIAALSCGRIQAIQLPYNVWDQRFQPIISLAAAQDIAVFARSVFLQGLFFLESDQANGFLPDSLSWISLLQGLSRECNRSVAELALCYVRDTSGVTAMVIGAETMDQVKANLQIMSAPPLSPVLRDQVSARFREVPLHVINPVMWARRSHGSELV